MEDSRIMTTRSLKDTVYLAFTAHPRLAGETYWQHFRFTIGMAGRLGLISVLLILHRLLPFPLTHAASWTSSSVSPSRMSR